MVKKLPKIITKEEFEKLLYSVPKKRYINKKISKEFQLAILLGFDAGLRISEVVGLKEEESKCCKTKIIYTKILDDNKKKVRAIYCEGCEKKLSAEDIRRTNEDKWTIKPLTSDKVEASHIRIESGKGQKDRIVPRPRRLNESAKKLLPIKIKRRTLQNLITKLGRDVLGKEITFHTLRHGFVTNCINKGMALHEVQMFAGHSRLDTTGIYLHANPEKALKKYEEVF